MYKIYNNSINTSGNNTTLQRISKLLNLNICNQIQNNIIGIHAFKFGSLICDTNINYILIIGGTDINIDILDNKKKDLIINTIKNAKFVVCFSEYIKKEVIKNVSVNNNQIKIIPQSISFEQPNNFNLKSFIKKTFEINKFKKIFLVVGNIRKVKDPNFLDSISKSLFNSGIIILFIGRNLEKNVCIKKPFLHTDNLSQKDIYSSYQQADGLINTSESEGMASAILEAMIYKCPVYARNNNGNLSIIRNRFNGFIFNTPEEFIRIIKLENKIVINNAYNYVLENHNSENEKKEYMKLIIP